MKKQTDAKIREVLQDIKLSEHQREVIGKWHKHVSTYAKEQQILERVYVIREFALFINKPLEEAKIEDWKRYEEYKRNDNRETVTNNRVMSVSNGSLYGYWTRLKGFYRYLYKNTHYEIDKEMAYPSPKIIKKDEISREERHKRRVMAILENRILSIKREDKGLSDDELRAKYPEQVLPKHNLKTLKDFYYHKITSGDVKSHIGFTTKLSFLKRFGIFLGSKGYKDAERSDIQEYLAIIQQRVGSINPSYKAFLLDFYRYVYGLFSREQPRKYPDVVAWLYTRRKKIDEKLAKSIIPDSAIKDMIDTCDNVRDKSIIAVLRDCSARIGELMNCRIKDIKVTEKGKADSKYRHHIATIKLVGKTGERVNLLHWSVSYLRQWIQVHPLRKNPDFENAPLFVARKESRYGQALTVVGVNKMLQKVAHLAGVKMHIHAHLFRHTNITHMAKVLSEQELKKHAGWGNDSKMTLVYVHLKDSDVHNKLLKNMGFDIDEKEQKEENLLKKQICPNHVCSYENTSDASFCASCGYPLKMETAIKLTKVKEQEDELQRELFSKDIGNTQVRGDMKEAMFQLLKSDPMLIEKLRQIAGEVH